MRGCAVVIGWLLVVTLVAPAVLRSMLEQDPADDALRRLDALAAWGAMDVPPRREPAIYGLHDRMIPGGDW